MSLEELVDNTRTDKNTTHSYLPLYEKLFNKKKETAHDILEIGVQYGGSIKLWSDYFINANIYGLDIMNIEQMPEDIKNKENIILYSSTDAYDEILFKNTFLNKNKKFDVIIDDGPHTLESFKQFILLYSQIMEDDGILIIEDIQIIDWLEELKKITPEHLQQFIKIYDLRDNKDRYDDIIFTIDKTILL
jgi:cephalosporin hydroxylase